MIQVGVNEHPTGEVPGVAVNHEEQADPREQERDAFGHFEQRERPQRAR
jgi:hypothetical protein